MKTIIKTAVLFLLIGLFSFSTESNGTWLTNFEIAKKKAKTDNKKILISFSGSDWCSNCKRLEKAVFEKKEFKDYAKKNLILLKADFPMKRKNKLSKEQTEHNEKLAEKYNKKGIFPTTLLINSSGKVIARFNAKQTDVNIFIEKVKKEIKK